MSSLPQLQRFDDNAAALATAHSADGFCRAHDRLADLAVSLRDGLDLGDAWSVISDHNRIYFPHASDIETEDRDELIALVETAINMLDSSDDIPTHHDVGSWADRFYRTASLAGQTSRSQA